jgi:hypothetical protein
MCDSLGQSDQKIKVWKLQVFGSWIIFNSLKDLIASLECDLDGIEEPEDIIISPVWMYEHELENLPEFEGH